MLAFFIPHILIVCFVLIAIFFGVKVAKIPAISLGRAVVIAFTTYGVGAIVGVASAAMSRSVILGAVAGVIAQIVVLIAVLIALLQANFARAIIVLFISVLPILTLIAASMLPALSSARERARRISCANNLKRIGLALKIYAKDNDGVYPWGKSLPQGEEWRYLGKLHPQYISDFGNFHCPSSKERKICRKRSKKYRTLPFHKNGTILELPEHIISYSYGINFTDGTRKPWTERASSSVYILADKKAAEELSKESNHKLDGRNVLYRDCHVRWKPGKDPLDADLKNPADQTGKNWWSDPPYSK